MFIISILGVFKKGLLGDANRSEALPLVGGNEALELVEPVVNDLESGLRREIHRRFEDQDSARCVDRVRDSWNIERRPLEDDTGLADLSAVGIERNGVEAVERG